MKTYYKDKVKKIYEKHSDSRHTKQEIMNIVDEMQKLIIKQKDILQEVQKDQRANLDANQKLKSDISRSSISHK